MSEKIKIAPQRGYTLLEMMIVVALLTLIAAIAVPSVSSSSEPSRLTSAGTQVADALRFAREESRRTGNIHGVSVEVANNRLRVFRLDQGPNPNLKVFDVYQPVTKQKYNVALGIGALRGVSLSVVHGQMVGSCSDPESIVFNSRGLVLCSEPIATRIRQASVDLAMGRLRLSVAIDSYTGRVSIQ